MKYALYASNVTALFKLLKTHSIECAVLFAGKQISLSEAYDDPRFHPIEKTVDKLRSVLCIPVTNRRGEVVAVLQLCNKSGSTMFSVDDTGLAERIV